jgi:hypothetical protein
MLCKLKSKWMFALIGIAFLYVASYALLLIPEHLGAYLLGGRICCYRIPKYRIGGELVHTVFWPIQWLDNRLRPSYWAWEEPVVITDDEIRAYESPEKK